MSNEHDRHNTVEHVACAVITVSDTRTVKTDRSGPLIHEILETAGHVVHSYEIMPDEPAVVARRVIQLCDDTTCRVVLLTGGTGLSPRDSTYESLSALFEKRIDGFGEIFRAVSFDRIGPAAMLSRAVAGVRNGTAVFSMPGSVGGVRTAMEKLIVPQLGHLVAMLSG